MENFESVSVWEEKVILPTYKVGKADKNPMFLEKRVYQGSSGKVYPHPVIDSISDEKTDVEYQAVFLENQFIKVMILPELGGRIQRATDKTNGYDFVYYNHVIKPALVGLAGPWISGGIEFNWPQHHRPSTFDPVDFTCTRNPDGSASVVVGEIENMFRTKGMARFTLYPDRAYIEIKAQLYNRTDVPQTFLWWANPAVPVNDNTRTIFPPDVTAVMDHGKRAVSTFPIATDTYYKVDYSKGVDISRYKNLPVPTSYMAAKSDYDFVGGYDDGIQAGILHVADHHIAPGKKQWTWGCGDFGKAWDKNLTDEDGPYVELMTGCFTDNQPDFAWIGPMEEKRFTQYFMPYQQIGTVHNATKDLAMNFEQGAVHLYAAGNIGEFTVKALAAAGELLSKNISMLPGQSAEIPVDGGEPVTEIQIIKNGNIYLSYKINCDKQSVPEAATAPPQPCHCETVEDLYLYGMHMEQYRHATRLPEDYYLEGLRRDPTDIRLNNAYGLLLLRRGLFEESEAYFRAAVKKMTRSNPNPYDSEAYYNLGLSLFYQNKMQESYDAFYKSAWSNASQEGAFYHMACLCAQNGQLDLALEHVENAIIKNSRNYKARNLKSLLLKQCGREQEAQAYAKETAGLDPLDVISRHILGELPALRTDSAIETALEYKAGGFYTEAVSVLEADQSKYPMVDYHLAHLHYVQGDTSKGDIALESAAAADSRLCFPHRLEDMLVLESAVSHNKNDAMAHYYLGCLYYDKKRYDHAVLSWEKAAGLYPDFPTVHRNLALAYYNKHGSGEKAVSELETAFALDQTDGRVLMELDQLYKKRNKTIGERLAFLERHLSLVEKRDDLYTEFITLLNQNGRYQEALDRLLQHRFHPWEGGEGKIPAQYIAALCCLAHSAQKEGDAKRSAELLKRTFTYPDNFGEGKLYGAQENLQNYLLGVTLLSLGDKEQANACFKKAASGLSEPQSALYYNDQPPETIFCQGLAHLKLNNEKAALACFDKLIAYGDLHENDAVHIDYFAVSLPDFLVFDSHLEQQNKIHCLFMKGLGYLGKGMEQHAAECLDQAAGLDCSHTGLSLYRRLFFS